MDGFKKKMNSNWASLVLVLLPGGVWVTGLVYELEDVEIVGKVGFH